MPKTQEVSKNQMSVLWRSEGDLLFVTMKAPTDGWVAVGFNSQPTLDGSLLVMGAVRDGELFVEEHIAQPPRHPPRVSLGGVSSLRALDGYERGGDTVISFSLDLSKRDAIAPSLRAGDSIFLTLAFSREDDFQHHSIMRTALQITL